MSFLLLLSSCSNMNQKMEPQLTKSQQSFEKLFLFFLFVFVCLYYGHFKFKYETTLLSESQELFYDCADFCKS